VRATLLSRVTTNGRLLPEELAGESDDPGTLQAQRGRYRALFERVVESFPHPVGVVGEDGVVTHWAPERTNDVADRVGDDRADGDRRSAGRDGPGGRQRVPALRVASSSGERPRRR